MPLNSRITKARSSAGLTKAQLAARLKLTRGAICQWEDGSCSPSLKNLKKLARVTKTTVADLLGAS